MGVIDARPTAGTATYPPVDAGGRHTAIAVVIPIFTRRDVAT